MRPDIKTLLRCFGRTYFIGANFNTKGMQNIGLAYAMDPGIQSVYSSPALLRKARKRYLQLYNTHPYWTPLLVGYFLFLEAKIAQGILQEHSLNKVKTTTMYTLSAIGDSFFGGSLLIFWSLVSVYLLVSGYIYLVCIWFILFFTGLQLFRFFTFWQGWKNGLTFLNKLKQLNLINWAHRIKILNVGVILLIWYEIIPFTREHFLPLAGGTLTLGFFAWMVHKRLVLREYIVAGLGLCSIICLMFDICRNFF